LTSKKPQMPDLGPADVLTGRDQKIDRGAFLQGEGGSKRGQRTKEHCVLGESAVEGRLRGVPYFLRPP